MRVSNKDIKRAIYRLKLDGRTPMEVINYISEKCSHNNIETSDDHDFPVEVVISKPFEIILNKFPLLRGWENLPRLTEQKFYEIVMLSFTGNKLRAVKELKSVSNFGLKESKDVIDFFEHIKDELIGEIKKRYVGQNINFQKIWAWS